MGRIRNKLGGLKSKGTNWINVELLKYTYNTINHTRTILYDRYLLVYIINVYWMTYEMTEKREGALMYLIFKKGDRNGCKPV
jgi:hypothetical protein